MLACPPDADLSAFLDDSLPPDGRDRLSAHVDGCPDCQARLDHLTADHGTAVVRYKDRDSFLAAGFVPQGQTLPTDDEPAGRGSVGDTAVIGRLQPAAPAMVGLPTVPGFDVEAEIGRGGMGVVYRAVHRQLSRPVALKMILVGAAAGPRAVQRFFFEAEVLARVRHPQVVQVYEVDVFQGAGGVPVPYLAMELLDGGTLADRLRASPRLAPRDAAALIEGVARAVHAVHSQGIVHRDLKPGNVLITAGVPKVTDFGLAKLVAGDGRGDLTASGTIVGTPAYMAPEQASSKGTIGPPADVYALGAMLFEALTGRPPFVGSEPAAVLLKVVNESPPDARSLRPEVPRDLAAVVDTCLRKEPHRRYASAADLADDLRRFLESRPTKARRPGSGERALLWARRNPAVAGLLACLAVVVLTAGMAVVGSWRRATVEAEAAREASAVAVAALAESDRQRTVADAREARLEFDRAVSLCEDGQVGPGLRGFVRCVELAEKAGEAGLARAARVHLAAWPARLSARVRTFPVGGRARAVAFTPDGRHLAVAGPPGAVTLWDADTGRKVRTFFVADDTATFYAVDVSPDGRRVAAGGSDGRIRVWATDGSANGFSLDAGGDKPGGPVRAVAFAPDGRLWAADGGTAAKRWNLDTRTRDGELASAILGTTIEALAPSADGDRLFTGDAGGYVFEWDARTEANIGGWPGAGAVTDLCLSPDGATLAAVGPHGVCRVIDRKSGRIDHHISLLGAAGTAVRFAPGGDLLLVGDGDGNVRTYHRATGQTVGVPVRFPGGLGPIRFRPGGDEFAVCAGDAVHLCRLARPAWRPLGPVRPGPVRALDFDPTGTRVAVGRTSPNRVDVYDAATAAVLHELKTPDETLVVRFDPARPRLLRGSVNGWGRLTWPDGKWSVADAKGPTPLLAPTADGLRVYTSDGSSLSCWDTDSSTPLRGNPSSGEPVRGVVASQKWAARVAAGRQVWGVMPAYNRLDPPAVIESLLVPLQSLPDEATALGGTPDGRHVLAGLRNNSAVWADVHTGKTVTVTHGRAVTAVAIGPDAATLLTASRDGTTRFWDAATGLQLGPTLKHAGPVSAVAFAPSGDRVATGTTTGHAICWDVPPPPLGGTGEELKRFVSTVSGAE